MDNTFLDPFIEGSWMTKHHGKYYLQYGAPGTEFSGYADGVTVANNPLGPFFNSQSDPLSMKLGGFARGAGHGATFQDNQKNYWHVSTIMLSVKNNFERRIGIWPAGFDQDDLMYCNTAFGDYPHYLPSAKLNGDRASGAASISEAKSGSIAATPFLNTTPASNYFTGWMLLNYNKPVKVSSTLGSYTANNAVDEQMKTYWSAATGNTGEWIESDLGGLSTIARYRSIMRIRMQNF